jgi:hypothetical protein
MGRKNHSTSNRESLEEDKHCISAIDHIAKEQNMCTDWISDQS